MASPLFTLATPEERRLKAYIFGPPGSGKTYTSLQFPGVVIFDIDGSSDWYADSLKYHRMKTTDIDKIYNAVDELIKDPQDFKTLVIDSATKFDQLLQEKHLKRLRAKKGNPQYVFQPLTHV